MKQNGKCQQWLDVGGGHMGDHGLFFQLFYLFERFYNKLPGAKGRVGNTWRTWVLESVTGMVVVCVGGSVMLDLEKPLHSVRLKEQCLGLNGVSP